MTPTPRQAGTCRLGDRRVRRCVWLPILVLAPFAILLFCAFPHTDDFCFGAMWRDRGLIGMLRDVYMTFMGRLFSVSVTPLPFIVHSSLGADLLVAHRGFCIAAFAAVLALALWACGAILPGYARFTRLFLSLVLAVVLVAGAPQPEHLLYWETGIGFYAIPAIFSLWTMIWLYRRAAERLPLGRPAVVLLMTGGFLIAMATEISGPVLSVIVLGTMAQRWLTPGTPRQLPAHALVLAAIAVGFAIVVAAPGNAVRMHAMGTDQGVPVRMLTAFPMTVVHLAAFLFRRLTNPALIGWLIVLAVAASTEPRRVVAVSGRVTWLPLVATLMAIYGSLWIGQVSTGRLLEQRALNYLHFILIGGLSLTMVSAAAAGQKLWRMIGARWPRLDGGGVVIAASLLMLATPHFWQATRIVLHVAGLHRAVADRFALLGDGKRPGTAVAERELVLPALLPGGMPWFDDFVSTDPTAWQNTCLADYVGVSSVRRDRHPVPSH